MKKVRSEIEFEQAKGVMEDLEWPEAVNAMRALLISMKDNRDKIMQGAYELLYHNWKLKNPETYKGNVPQDKFTQVLDFLWNRFFVTFWEEFGDEKTD